MKTKPVLCALFILCARPSFALKRPLKAELDAIEAQIALAKGMDKQILAAEELRDNAVLLVETTEAMRRSLGQAIEQEKAKQIAAQTKAIQLTILAYDIAPKHLVGKSVMKWTKGRTITWFPVAGEIADRLVQKVDGKLRESKKPNGEAAGATFPDGVSYIPRTTFERGPAYLASILLHERTHFDQYTTDGRGNSLTRAERNQEAYRAQIDNAKYFFDTKKTTDADALLEIRGLLLAANARVESEKGILGLIRRLLPDEGKPDVAETNVHTNEELADIKGLVTKARAQAEIGHRETLKREAAAKAAADLTAQRNHDDQLKSALVQLALRSCASPGSVTQPELDALPRPYRKNFYFKDPESGSGWLPDGIGDCMSPYGYLAHGGRSADALRREAEPQTIPSIPQAIAVPPTPQYVPPEATKPPFSRVLPQYKSYAVNACSAPQQIRSEMFLIQAYDHSYREYDENLVRGLKNGMSSCASQLFDYLIAHKRRNNIDALQPDAVRAAVSSYTPVYSSPGRGSPRQNEPGCEYDPNIGGTICPKSL